MYNILLYNSIAESAYTQSCLDIVQTASCLRDAVQKNRTEEQLLLFMPYNCCFCCFFNFLLLLFVSSMYVLIFLHIITYSTTVSVQRTRYWTLWTHLKEPITILRYAFRFWSLWCVQVQFFQCTTVICIKLNTMDTRVTNLIRTHWDWSTRYVTQ